MAFDYSKLRGRIKEKYGSEREFAKALGISAPTLSSKLNNTTDWTSDQVLISCELLDIEPAEMSIFFYSLVRKSEQND